MSMMRVTMIVEGDLNVVLNVVALTDTIAEVLVMSMMRVTVMRVSMIAR